MSADFKFSMQKWLDQTQVTTYWDVRVTWLYKLA
jgi:hypothetical protein